MKGSDFQVGEFELQDSFHTANQLKVAPLWDINVAVI